MQSISTHVLYIQCICCSDLCVFFFCLQFARYSCVIIQLAWNISFVTLITRFYLHSWENESSNRNKKKTCDLSEVDSFVKGKLWKCEYFFFVQINSLGKLYACRSLLFFALISISEFIWVNSLKLSRLGYMMNAPYLHRFNKKYKKNQIHSPKKSAFSSTCLIKRLSSRFRRVSVNRMHRDKKTHRAPFDGTHG